MRKGLLIFLVVMSCWVQAMQISPQFFGYDCYGNPIFLVRDPYGRFVPMVTMPVNPLVPVYAAAPAMYVEQPAVPVQFLLGSAPAQQPVSSVPPAVVAEDAVVPGIAQEDDGVATVTGQLADLALSKPDDNDQVSGDDDGEEMFLAEIQSRVRAPRSLLVAALEKKAEKQSQRLHAARVSGAGANHDQLDSVQESIQISDQRLNEELAHLREFKPGWYGRFSHVLYCTFDSIRSIQNNDSRVAACRTVYVAFERCNVLQQKVTTQEQAMCLIEIARLFVEGAEKIDLHDQNDVDLSGFSHLALRCLIGAKKNARTLKLSHAVCKKLYDQIGTLMRMLYGPRDDDDTSSRIADAKPSPAGAAGADNAGPSQDNDDQESGYDTEKARLCAVIDQFNTTLSGIPELHKTVQEIIGKYKHEPTVQLQFIQLFQQQFGLLIANLKNYPNAQARLYFEASSLMRWVYHNNKAVETKEMRELCATDAYCYAREARALPGLNVFQKKHLELTEPQDIKELKSLGIYNRVKDKK